MSRPSILSTVAIAAATLGVLASPAAAQTAGQPTAARQLSWQGRGEAVMPTTQPAPVAAPTSRRPNPVIPHGGMASVAATPGLTPAPESVPGRLTPANAWLHRSAPVAVQTEVAEAPPPPQPQPAPQPAIIRPAPQPDAPPPPVRRAPQPQPQPRALPDFLPDRGGQPAPAPVVEAAPAPPADALQAEAAIDPMAPRRDAPIFRMQQAPAAAQPVVAQQTAELAPPPRAARPAPEAEPAPVSVVRNTADRPPQQGARYYSVHRQNGQQPDAMVMPEPTYVDALTLTLPETPASQDLAQPEQGPTLIRDNQRRVRPAPAASDGDHQ